MRKFGLYFAALALFLGFSTQGVQAAAFNTVVNVTPPGFGAPYNPTSYYAGATATYTFTTQNTSGSSIAAGVATLTFAVPAGTTLAPGFTTDPNWTASGVPAVGGTGTIICTNNNAFANGTTTATFTLVVKLLSSLPSGTSVTFTATAANGLGGTGAGTQTVTSAVFADPAVTMSLASAAPFYIGAQVTYNVKVLANIPSDASNVTLTSDFGAVNTNLTFVSIIQTGGQAGVITTPSAGNGNKLTVFFANLPVTGSNTSNFTIVAQIKQSVAVNTIVNHTVSVSTTGTNASTANDSSSVNTGMVQASSDVVVMISSVPTVTAPAGGNVVYTISLQNNGPTDAQGVNFTTAVPANMTFVSISGTLFPSFSTAGPITGNSAVTIPSGTAAVITLTLNVNTNTVLGTTLPLTVSSSASASTPDPNTGNNTNITYSLTSGITSDVTIPSCVGSPSPFVPGASTITYTFNVINNGPSTATNVSISDTLPAGASLITLYQGVNFLNPGTTQVGNVLSYNLPAPLLSGTNLPFTLTLSVPSSASNLANLVNSVTANVPANDSNLANNTAISTVPINGSADLGITVVPSANPVIAGNQFFYTITVNNSGPSDAYNLTMNFAFPGPNQVQYQVPGSVIPAGWTQTSTNNTGDTVGPFTATAPSLAAGASAQFILVFVINPTVSTPLVNTASVSSTISDPVAANNSTTTNVNVGAQPSVSVADTTVPEGNVGIGFAPLTFTLSAPNSQVVSVDFTTVDGSAISPIDYQVTVGTVIFQPGQTTSSVSIPIVGNYQVEPDKTFTVQLSNPQFTSISRNTATVTIQNDDFGGSLQFAASSFSANENAGTATITVSRLNALAGNTTVNYATSDGTAINGLDYTATSGTLTFLGGSSSQTFTIPLLNRSAALTSATVNLSLSNPNSGAVFVPGASATLGSQSTATLVILARPAFVSSALVVGQIGSQFSYTLAASGEVPINFTLGTGAALPPGLSFTAGAGFITGVPTAIGTYTLPVVATNSVGTDTQTLTIQISAIPASGSSFTTLDSDGDGFPNELETFFGSNPFDKNSTPADYRNLTLSSSLDTKLAISLNFAKRGADSLTLSGSLILPAQFQQSGRLVCFDIGGVINQYALDANGVCKVGNGSTKFKFPKAGYGLTSVTTFTFTLKNADFQGTTPAVFDDEGLTNTYQINAIRTVPVIVLVQSASKDSILYNVQQVQLYSAKPGKSGKTKNP